MSARRLALLGLAALLLLSPLAAAGSSADPETGPDGNDDVEVNGTTCGMPTAGAPVPFVGNQCLWQPDFIWANIDIDWAWVNDTASDVVLTVKMKFDTAFSPDAGMLGGATEAGGFAYTYTFAFTVDGTPYAAIATMGADGVIALGGVASAFTVHDGNQLTVTVPKDVVGASANGAVIGALTFFAHGDDGSGNTLDDVAPDNGAAPSRDYLVANSTVPGANATDNATAPASNSGSASQGPSGPSIVTGTSTGPRPTISGTADPSSGRTSADPTFGVTKDDKESPALPAAVAALALVALVAVLRRRL